MKRSLWWISSALWLVLCASAWRRPDAGTSGLAWQPSETVPYRSLSTETGMTALQLDDSHAAAGAPQRREAMVLTPGRTPGKRNQSLPSLGVMRLFEPSALDPQAGLSFPEEDRSGLVDTDLGSEDMAPALSTKLNSGWLSQDIQQLQEVDPNKSFEPFVSPYSERDPFGTGTPDAGSESGNAFAPSYDRYSTFRDTESRFGGDEESDEAPQGLWR